MRSAIERARSAFARLDWREACSAYAEAAAHGSLGAGDHERRAICAYLVGLDDESAEAWEAAYRMALEVGDGAVAARAAFWLGLCLMLEGHSARAGGWLARATRLIDEGQLQCAASGYLLIPELVASLHAGDPARARELAVRAVEVSRRFDDADLRAFGTLGHGQALLAEGDVTGGTARLDEVMVAVTAGEVGPITSGIVYCAVILECMRLFDIRRASEWTGALSAWCEAQPDLVPFRGQCLVHRSQLQQAAGAWEEASNTAEAACRRLTDPPHPALGLAYYQEAELRRLTGAFDGAESGYRLASRNGYHPMPGLALLELARGDADAAAASIGRALQESRYALDRPPLLFAAVEIHCANQQAREARAAADELKTIAAHSSSDVLAAMAAQAAGAVLLAERDPARALGELRTAAAVWQALRMPYEAARAAVLLGLACSTQGDRTSAELEFANARDKFAALGAAPDLDGLQHLTNALETGSVTTGGPGPTALSAREREVLTHVAAGKTNRAIAEELVISEHTVGRHLENIFTKLGVNSRAAATAYAYEHELLGGSEDSSR